MLKNELLVPEGVEIRLEGSKIFVKGPKGELQREFKNPHIKTKIESGKLEFTSELERKNIKALMGTWRAHTENMISGVAKGWVAELKLVYSHFPVKLKTENKKLLIENFLGEKKPRVAPIPEEVEVKIEKNTIFISGLDKEKVGQTAARVEQTTKVRGYDKRVFQDGIYIVRKPYIAEEGG